MSDTRKVFIKTFGCQMNVYDSERMTEALGSHGYAVTEDATDADLVVLNTCHIREKAAEKVYSDLGRYRDIKIERQAAGKDTVVAVTGCVAQAEGAEIVARAPLVDLVIGPQAYHRLPDLISKARTERRQIVDTEFPDEDKFGQLPARRGPRAASAFLTVQEGCDKFCTFCVVPYTRGMEMSRPVEQVVAEARRLVEDGVREITLLGQNVNAYHGEGSDGRPWSLAELLGRLSDIPMLERLRYTTSHLRDMGDDLIEAHRDLPKLMPYLHLPVQAGADRILAAMNRKHTAAEYLSLIDRIRAARPDIALSTDIIVGFPGETEGEFRETLELIREVGFAQAYSFKYSPRPGTPASNMDDQVPEQVKTERLQQLQALLQSQQIQFNSGCVGKVFPVLFERLGRRSGQLIGRSPYLQSVHAEAEPSLLGRILNVEISGAGTNSLAGVVV
ncbi:tRNA (N6-isopentenyl adenosine(37)-C2)-methylthiotransferase MiaB [Leptospira interrogans]